MKIIENIFDLKAIPKLCCLTIGNFDGVHIGHRKILSAAREQADKRAAELVVMTFDPHPVAILHPEMAPERLATPSLKLHLLEKAGADFIYLVKDSRQFLDLSPKDFVEQFLCRKIKPSVVVEGEDFYFGVNRTGNIHTLTYLGAEFGFEVIIVEPVAAKLSIGPSVKISSTLIRNLLLEGKVADAAICLGRPYRLIGQVTAGKGKGKRLGFPTANLDNSPRCRSGAAGINQLIPAEAVYAATAEIGESEQDICQTVANLPAAISIGRAETYDNDNPLLVEAHLLVPDVSELHGKWMALDFVEKIRNQQKFKNEKQLADQIADDCKKVRRILLADSADSSR
jgi:riboflavin kinase/FMN adenylyltransferase